MCSKIGVVFVGTSPTGVGQIRKSLCGAEQFIENSLRPGFAPKMLTAVDFLSLRINRHLPGGKIIFRTTGGAQAV